MAQLRILALDLGKFKTVACDYEAAPAVTTVRGPAKTNERLAEVRTRGKRLSRAAWLNSRSVST